MRIVHLVDLAQVGGVESLFVDFIQADPPAGMKVEHITLLDRRYIASRFRKQLAQFTTVRSSRCVGPLILPRRPYWLRAYNRLRQIRSARPDLVLVWNQFTDFRLRHLGLRCPIVYYEHGMSWYRHHPQQLAVFFSQVTAAIAVSSAARSMLTLKHHVRFPIHLCRNPIRPALLPGTLPARSLPKKRPLRVGLAARLVPLKAVGLLVLAAAELQRAGRVVEVWIAGDGPERGVIESLTIQQGLQQRVRLLGQIDDMALFYSQIDVFVLTSMHETMPLVCLEAMAYGLPVIASNIDGFVEIIHHDQTGYCLTPTLSIAEYAVLTGASTDFAHSVYDPVTDSLIGTRLLRPTDIASAIMKLADDEPNYCLMAQKAALKAQQDYKYSVWLENFYKLLAELSQVH